MNGSWPSWLTLEPGVGGLDWVEGRMPLAGDDGEPRRKWRDRLERRVLWRQKREGSYWSLLCIMCREAVNKYSKSHKLPKIALIQRHVFCFEEQTCLFFWINNTAFSKKTKPHKLSYVCKNICVGVDSPVQSWAPVWASVCLEVGW